MIKKIERPTWYKDSYYDKKRTHEEWLYDIWKRDKFNRDDCHPSVSIRVLTLQDKVNCFLEMLSHDKSEEFLSHLRATPSQPIRHVSISDAFRMVSLITNSDWYKNHPQKKLFENAITALSNGNPLTHEEKIAFDTFYNIPWHAFHANSNDDEYYPNRDFTHLSGIPITVDPSYAKQDITKQLNTHLQRWVGKLQHIELHFKNWHESKILAIFDLIMWFKIQDIKYTNASLHRLIWPTGRFSSAENEYVNPDDDIEHGITLMKRVINQSVVRSLLIMCEARKVEK